MREGLSQGEAHTPRSSNSRATRSSHHTRGVLGESQKDFSSKQPQASQLLSAHLPQEAVFMAFVLCQALSAVRVLGKLVAIRYQRPFTSIQSASPAFSLLTSWLSPSARGWCWAAPPHYGVRGCRDNLAAEDTRLGPVLA